MKLQKFDRRYLEYQTKKRGLLRQIIRNAYIKQTSELVEGKTIDFGCGPGEILFRLPAGSMGFDVNSAAIEHCMKKGLKAVLYIPTKDNFLFSSCRGKGFRTFLASHVLEHIPHADKAIRSILKACRTLKIRKIVFIVPGLAGFRSDPTHRTFIDKKYLKERGLLSDGHFSLKSVSYSPFGLEWVGRIFRYNEMIVIYED